MNKRVTVSLAALGAVAAGIVYQFKGGHALRAEHPHEDSSDVAALKAEVAALRQEARTNARGVNALRAETGRISEAVAVASARVDAQEQAPAEPSEPPPRPDRDPERRAAWEAERRAFIASTEADFSGEARNVEWSSQTANSIRETAEKHGAASSLVRNIDCRSKTCRIEVLDREETRDDLQQFLIDTTVMFPNVVADHIVGPNDEASYVLYLMAGA